MPLTAAAVVTAQRSYFAKDDDSPLTLKERVTLQSLRKELKQIGPVVPASTSLSWLACVEMALKVNSIEAALVAYVGKAIWLDARRLNALVDSWYSKAGISRVKTPEHSVTSTLAFLRKFETENLYHWHIRYILMYDCDWPDTLKAHFYRTIDHEEE